MTMSSAKAPRRLYLLHDKQTGEDYEVGAEELLRVVGVELSVVDWAICLDGTFENGRWCVEQG